MFPNEIKLKKKMQIILIIKNVSTNKTRKMRENTEPPFIEKKLHLNMHIKHLNIYSLEFQCDRYKMIAAP